ncbi:MAG TPA: helix-turn-helix transcriptional regulator [Coxiellaceae bacterium]|nr:MAG: hypothetical protein A3E81_06820 [Gammaproteobacteria bacterium RIFCSPHIGHO2_12_FULL_36_30]HLB56462.1 helix-turn-helix transcriptional regulator [Coxiellaceae bacterium]
MKKHHINFGKKNKMIILRDSGVVYKIPKKIARKYITTDDDLVSVDDVFSEINKKYTKPGALLRGIRMREHLTQTELAEKLKVTQSDISQMESGVRPIGRIIARRIEKLFDLDYRSFLA